jgi:hypothetical protein
MNNNSPSTSAALLQDFATAIASNRIRVIDLTQTLRPSTPVIQLPPEFAPSNPFSISEISHYGQLDWAAEIKARYRSMGRQSELVCSKTCERPLCARSRHSKTDKARLLGPLVPHAAILGERQEQVIEYPHGNLSLDSCLSSDDAVRSGLVNPVGQAVVWYVHHRGSIISCFVPADAV